MGLPLLENYSFDFYFVLLSEFMYLDLSESLALVINQGYSSAHLKFDLVAAISGEQIDCVAGAKRRGGGVREKSGKAGKSSLCQALR